MSNESNEATTMADPRPMTSAQLMAEAKRAQAIAEEMLAQAGALALAEEAARKPKQPDLSQGPQYVVFTKYQSGREYHYAAIGWRWGRSDRWTVTGQTSDRFTWAGLLAFIGEANWSSLAQVAALAPMVAPGNEPPVAERMGRYGTVIGVRLIDGSGDPFNR